MKKKSSLLFLMLSILLTSCEIKITTTLLCDHEYEKISETDSTCKEKGKIVEKCSLCEKEKVTKKDLLPHDFELVIKDSTCISQGSKKNVCKNCNYEEWLETFELKPHNFESKYTDPTCTEQGYTTKVCTDCNYQETLDYVDALGHSVSSWNTLVEPTEVSDGLREGKCEICDVTFQEIIISSSYVDSSVLKVEFDESKRYECNSYEEVSKIFNAAIFNNTKTLRLVMNYDFSFNSMISQLIEDCNIDSAFSINASLLSKELTLTMTYDEMATKKTSEIAYTQHDSLNYVTIDSNRSSSYDNFKINNSLYSYEVSTSQQLYYVLERGYKPICKAGSIAETIYNEMKKVLREIINDDMDDISKVKAIHDYLVMNVNYDDELLQKLYNGVDNLNSYQGFYLEGVFLNKVAVCEGISKAFTSLCNIEGIPCVSVEGYQTLNPQGAGHAWNKVYVNNKWYIVDATSDGTIISDEFEVLSYNYFLVDYAFYKKTYTETTYSNIKCIDSIDIYSLTTYKFNGNEYDLLIENQEELNVLVLYFESIDKQNLTIQFKASFDYGASLLDEVKKAYQENGLYKSYSYIEDENSFMLIK